MNVKDPKNPHCKWCSARNCNNSKNKRPDLAFFRFPLDPVRSKQWVHLIERYDDLGEKCAKQLYDNNVLCEVHFEPWCFRNTKRKLLTQEAFPTLIHNVLDHEPRPRQANSSSTSSSTLFQSPPKQQESALPSSSVPPCSFRTGSPTKRSPQQHTPNEAEIGFKHETSSTKRNHEILLDNAESLKRKDEIRSDNYKPRHKMDETQLKHEKSMQEEDEIQTGGEKSLPRRDTIRLDDDQSRKGRGEILHSPTLENEKSPKGLDKILVDIYEKSLRRRDEVALKKEKPIARKHVTQIGTEKSLKRKLQSERTLWHQKARKLLGLDERTCFGTCRQR
ncbi:52 kDa repressor of the inhibitor of the protein kinase [Elysia marginata]|uniref:52 kDa repressor of the inhibitor of the protein kinase n=1 Tax=Elysia marginata TaxID=1093978 RepID=A0AAV4J180_9GAST|nr:52 kDa repressor of the inhibitor of the protein kinase [Elysia marginata]